MPKTNTNPELRFAGFTEDWVPSKLGNIGEVKMCKRIFNNQTSPKGDIPFYKIGTFGKKADSHISKELYQEFRNKYPFPKKGDILMSASGTLGRIVVYDGKPAYFQDSNIVWLNHNESKILNEFLYCIYGNITYESEGGTIQRLYNSIILNARFSFPESKDEQKLIGNFLKNIDNLIAEHQRKHSKLKSLKNAMLDKMFPKQGQLIPEIRFKGFEGDWEEKKLGELGDFKSNGVDKKISPKETPVNLLNYMDVYNSRIINSTNCKQLMQVTAKPNQVIENNVLANDIFFTPSSETPEDIGKIMTIEEDLPNTVYSYHLMRFRPKSNVFYSFYPNYGFACELVRKQLILAAQGVQRYVLNKPSFEQINILLPTIDEQEKIAIYFRNIDNSIRTHDLQITKLQNIKKAFLAKMFV